ncbi:MAG: LCP family protein [Candidatus Saccharibacteria bacterium]|nr:LCP family protein [Candidatus Saccharibacteria bacterium]
MDKNKSIDGLKTASKKSGAKKTVAVQPAIKPATKTAKKPAPKAVVNPIAKKPAAKKTIKPVVIDTVPDKKSVEKSFINTDRSEVTENFLAPTTVFEFDQVKSDPKPVEKEQKVTEKEEKPKKHKKKRVVLTIILVVIFVLMAGATALLLWGNDIIMKITGGRDNIFGAFGALISDTYEPLKTSNNGRTNILAFGTSGYDMDGTEGDHAHDGAQLTDSIMVISLDQKTGDIAMLSLPRDLKATPTCTSTGKINEIYWCKNMNNDNEEAGAQALMNEVGGILGLDFQYYVHVNWQSLIQIVNTLGGIKVTLDEDIHDYNWTKAVYDAGVEYEINGEQALGLARARHGTTLGDFSRGNSQQKILIGIKNKIYETNLSLGQMTDLAGALGDNLRSNLTFSEIKTAAHLTFEFDLDSMRQVSLLDWTKDITYMTTANINGISYVVPSAGVGNYTAIKKYVEQQFNSDPVVREAADIMVLNGTETEGLAASEKKSLEEDGFTIKTIDNAPEGTYTQKYLIVKLGDNIDGTIKGLEKRYSVTATDVLPEGINGGNHDIIIILGEEKPEEPEETEE